jgi:hypothetical protein
MEKNKKVPITKQMNLHNMFKISNNNNNYNNNYNNNHNKLSNNQINN